MTEVHTYIKLRRFYFRVGNRSLYFPTGLVEKPISTIQLLISTIFAVIVLLFTLVFIISAVILAFFIYIPFRIYENITGKKQSRFRDNIV